MAKRTRRLGWSGAAALLVWVGCAEPPGEEGMDATAESGGGEVSGQFTSQTATITSSATGDGHSSDATDDGNASVAESGSDGGPGTASATGVSMTDGADAGGEDPASSCGVELVPDPGADNEFVCGCDVCNVEFRDVTPESGWAAVEACACICEVVGCGGSVSGGATSAAGSDTGDGDTGGTGDSGGATDPSGTSDPTDPDPSDTDPGDTDGSDTDPTDTSFSTSSN